MTEDGQDKIQAIRSTLKSMEDTVSPERLQYLASILYCTPWDSLKMPDRREVYKIALMSEQVEQIQQAAFFLQEAYDIYNARFR